MHTLCVYTYTPTAIALTLYIFGYSCPKGNYPRSSTEERFIPGGSSAFIARQFAELSGKEEAILEVEKQEAMLEAMQRQEEEERARAAALEHETQRQAEEEAKRKEDHLLAIADKNREEWEKELMAGVAAKKEPTEEEAALVAQLAQDAMVKYNIPESLLSTCRVESDVQELIEYMLQFREIDFDNRLFFF
jgi:hypothetical protein